MSVEPVAKNWILKILSGVHVGAEVVLSSAEVVLGQDESCDLVLDDVSLSGRHISLHMEGEQALLTLLDTARAIYVGEQKLESGELVLEPFQLITIGTLFLAVGPLDAEWPAIDLQIKQKMTVLSRNEETSAVAADALERDADDEDEAASAITGRYSHLIQFIAATPILALLVLYAFLLLAIDASTLTLEEITTEVQEIAAHYGAVVEVEQKYEGDTHINGYTDTEVQRQDFLTELEDRGIKAETKIVSTQQTANSLSVILDNKVNRGKANRVEVVKVPNSPGDFILKGYVGDAELWESTLAQLQRRASYHSLVDEVQNLDDRIKALKLMLVAANLEEVEIEPGNQGLLVLPGSQAGAELDQRLADVIKAFNQQFAPYPLLTTPKDGKPSGSPPQLKLNIRGISFGSTPHITMSHNRRYGIGSRLENGYIIKSITSEYILLQKDGKSEYYYLDEMQ